MQRGSTPSGFSVPLSLLASPGQTTLQRATRRLRRESLGNTNWTPTRWPSTARAVFYGSCNMTVRKRQRSVAAFFLPWCTSTGTTACLSRAKNISSDSSHSSFKLFDLLPSGASEPKKTYDPKKRFFAKAITNLNSHMHWLHSPNSQICTFFYPPTAQYLILLIILCNTITVQYVFIVHYHYSQCPISITHCTGSPLLWSILITCNKSISHHGT